jgi:DNA-binding CsgD family transcriptional regulator
MFSAATLAAALDFVGAVADASDDAEAFARRGVEGLRALVPCDLATLTVCDLRSVRDAEARTHRIGGSSAWTALRESALYDGHYRAIGPDHAVALPLHVGDGWLVCFVLNRKGLDFSDDEVALLELVRRPLARLFRRSGALAPVRAARPSLPSDLPVTRRERDALTWVAAGKTDRDIADILGISPRTVHKHLQHAYAKLGVETRTAAVMRALAA